MIFECKDRLIVTNIKYITSVFVESNKQRLYIKIKRGKSEKRLSHKFFIDILIKMVLSSLMRVVATIFSLKRLMTQTDKGYNKRAEQK